MINLIILSSIILIFAALAFYRLGRKSYETKVLKQDLKTSEKAKEIIKNQRDNRIDNLDDADRVWDTINND